MEMPVQNLAVGVGNRILADIVLSSSSVGETKSLAEIVHRKRNGNIILVIEILKSLLDGSFIAGLHLWSDAVDVERR